MKYFSFITFILLLVGAYQNCAAPIQDLGNVDKTSVTCPSSPTQVSISYSQQGNLSRFSVEAEDVDEVRWSVPNHVENQLGSGNSFDYSFSNSGDYTVLVRGMMDHCDVPVFSGWRNIQVNLQGSPACNETFTLSVSSSSVQLNQATTISLTNAAAFQSGTIRWQVDGEDRSEWNGLSNISFQSNQAGTYTITAFAIANCGTERNASATINVSSSANGPPALLNFDVKPYHGMPNPIRSGSRQIDNVYKVPRGSGKRISFNYSNLQNLQADDLTSVSGTNCTYGRCYNFDIVSTSTNVCELKQKVIVASGTNGQTESHTFFIYCPSGMNYCHTGLLQNKLANEACSLCGINMYLPSGATSCQPVGNGYYSPANNNTRLSCTNKPANSHYIGPGANGINNCPWACNSGYNQSGGSCVGSGGGSGPGPGPGPEPIDPY